MGDPPAKTAIVTGANAGIGREVAQGLVARGWRVILACRDTRAAGRAAEDIAREAPGGAVEVGPALDLADNGSVRNFVKGIGDRPVHLLVNNAAVNFVPKWHTEDGVAGMVQVNYLGPYLLTRLLAPSLRACAPSRVVHVSSVMHRLTHMPRPAAFLSTWSPSCYANTKLANILFANEFHRREGPLGVHSCAVDPGGVRTRIYAGSIYARPPLSWAVDLLFAPPSDGAQAVLHAATCDWPPTIGRDSLEHGPGTRSERRELLQILRKGQSPVGQSGSRRGSASNGFSFYARGLFASPLVTRWGGGGEGWQGAAWGAVYALVLALHAAMDYPIRRMSGGRWGGGTRAVPAAPQAGDARLALELWNSSAEIVGLPRHS
ncbi:unnamed protein product [Ostreobium quekettii]|uniref:Uncharacterized protein n=1 Tax=Ostreobium quekettii TaxID=121088 RepID=A0A8S1IP21_9CHLO|nr:unnamed protein product [Ostreobium quekettii]